MPQRQRTAPPKLDAEALPELTPQQQEFVRLRLAGKTASDAYRAAFTTENMLPRTIWAEASRLSAHPSVTAWLAAGRQACLGTGVLTRDAHMAELERIREIALNTGNIGAAVAAEQTRGKVAGHHIDRIQEVPADPKDTLATIAEHQPDLAAQLAAAHGIPWDASQRATKH
jgi:phage terminase small subunit